MLIEKGREITPLASEMYSELKRKYKIAKRIILFEAVVLTILVANFKRE